MAFHSKMVIHDLDDVGLPWLPQWMMTLRGSSNDCWVIANCVANDQLVDVETAAASWKPQKSMNTHLIYFQVSARS